MTTRSPNADALKRPERDGYSYLEPYMLDLETYATHLEAELQQAKARGEGLVKALEYCSEGGTDCQDISTAALATYRSTQEEK